ncbi:MAG: NUDIX hydrolase [Desulfobacteraceae bacterium]|nr:NUDIX hydrolase [Desulfobacteraceae bacterium]
MTARVNHRQTLRKGRVFEVTLENVTFSNGFTADMEIIRHPGASAIVPLTEDEQVVLLKQYRHAIGTFIWEIPAGTFNGQEDPLVCARRELTEETGFTAAVWDRLGAITPVPGYSDERIQIFLARQLQPAAQHLDQDEFLEVHHVPLNQVVEMIVKGEIQDAKTVMGIFLTLQKLKR